VDFSEVARAALAAQDARLRAAGLAVRADVDGPVPVLGDADRLHQAIANLLANAARYCRTGDEVSLRVAADGGLAVAQVADTGPGIAPDALPHVFERLWRGPDSRSVAGSGIGLAVVRELVTAHGGTVDAESTPGHGATFTIRLPLAGGP
jgi:two-component system sensor histidine kinase BaeS